MVSCSGPGQDAVRNKRLLFVSFEPSLAREHDTAGVRSSQQMIRILGHEHLSLEIFKEMIETNEDSLLITHNTINHWKDI